MFSLCPTAKKSIWATVLPGPWNDCSSLSKMKQTGLKQSNDPFPSVSVCEVDDKAERNPPHSATDYPNWMPAMHVRENHPTKYNGKTVGVMILQRISFKKTSLTWK